MAGKHQNAQNTDPHNQTGNDHLPNHNLSEQCGHAYVLHGQRNQARAPARHNHQKRGRHQQAREAHRRHQIHLSTSKSTTIATSTHKTVPSPSSTAARLKTSVSKKCTPPHTSRYSQPTRNSAERAPTAPLAGPRATLSNRHIARPAPMLTATATSPHIPAAGPATCADRIQEAPSQSISASPATGKANPMR